MFDNIFFVTLHPKTKKDVVSHIHKDTTINNYLINSRYYVNSKNW